MCVVAAKYFKDTGWVGVKNRDRNYLPSIKIVQSDLKGLQRIFIYDKSTDYTEGLNEYGLCIISSTMDVIEDEKPEHQKALIRAVGKKVRDALLEKTPQAALKKLIASELTGATFVFNERECHLLEGGYDKLKSDATPDNPRVFKHTSERLENKPNNVVVRTNHGIMIPDIGYQKSHDEANDGQCGHQPRASSEKRMKYAEDSLKKVKQVTDMLDGLAIKDADKETYFNPIRLGDPEKGDVVTTGQLMVVPQQKTLHYRPLYSEIEVNYSGINGPDKKTYFEIVSSRDLIAFKEHYNPWK